MLTLHFPKKERERIFGGQDVKGGGGGGGGYSGGFSGGREQNQRKIETTLWTYQKKNCVTCEQPGGGVGGGDLKAHINHHATKNNVILVRGLVCMSNKVVGTNLAVLTFYSHVDLLRNVVSLGTIIDERR